MRARGDKKSLILAACLAAILMVSAFVIAIPIRTYASDSGLVINEIYPNQIADGIDNEWAELYDPLGSDLIISDYSLVKITTSGTAYTKLLSEVMCSYKDGFYICNLGTNWIANSSSTIVLRKGSLEIDRVTFGASPENAPIPGQGQSVSRISNGSDSDVDANDFQIIPVTKGAENISPPPISYSDRIIISELLPQPATGSPDEFIELFNNSDTDEDLINWQLDAGTISKSTIIEAHGYLVFKNPEIHIGLTDTGDTTNLIDPNGTIKSTVNYVKTYRGQSYSLFSDGWLWTEELTPGSENILKISMPSVEKDETITATDIKTARQKEDGETVLVIGVVSVIPGALSSQYFYIQDDLSGIQIYNYNKLFPPLKAGDVVSVVGELASISNERRIKTLDATDIVLIRQNSSPLPKILKINQIREENEGEYIEFSGVVSATSGSTFYVQENGEIQVVIRDSTGIKKPKMKRGDKVQISGILSQYQDHYRVLPISQDGVKILTSGMLPIAGSDSSGNLQIKVVWRLRLDQPMKRKRLVTNLERN